MDSVTRARGLRVLFVVDGNRRIQEKARRRCLKRRLCISGWEQGIVNKYVVSLDVAMFMTDVTRRINAQIDGAPILRTTPRVRDCITSRV